MVSIARNEDPLAMCSDAPFIYETKQNELQCSIFKAFKQNLGALRNRVDGAGYGDAQLGQPLQIHVTHELKQANGSTIFCQKCVAWNPSRRKLSFKMKNECKRYIAPGNVSTLKLLRAGVTPTFGAKMPEGVKVTHKELWLKASRQKQKR